MLMTNFLYYRYFIQLYKGDKHIKLMTKSPTKPETLSALKYLFSKNIITVISDWLQTLALKILHICVYMCTYIHIYALHVFTSTPTSEHRPYFCENTIANIYQTYIRMCFILFLKKEYSKKKKKNNKHSKASDKSRKVTNEMNIKLLFMQNDK